VENVEQKMTKREALTIILEINSNTVIDDVWYEYFIDDFNKLRALLVLFNYQSYKQLLDDHEGSTLAELIEDLHI